MKVNTKAKTEITALDADPSKGMSSVSGILDDGVATSTQPRQRSRRGASHVAPSILARELWGSDKSGRQESADSPSNQLKIIGGSSSRPHRAV